MKYIIETYTLCDGWINIWSHEDWAGITIPTTFDTREDAEAELEYFLEDEKEEYSKGNIAGLSDPDDFRIVELNHDTEGWQSHYEAEEARPMFYSENEV